MDVPRWLLAVPVLLPSFRTPLCLALGLGLIGTAATAQTVATAESAAPSIITIAGQKAALPSTGWPASGCAGRPCTLPDARL
jgi:hypothetical protein